MIQADQQEIKALTDKAEAVDHTPLADGYRLSEEIARRVDRIRALEEARRFMEASYQAHKKELQAEDEAKMSARQQKQAEGGGQPTDFGSASDAGAP